MTSYRPSLLVYIVWHPDFRGGAKLAEHLYSRFSRDLGDPLAQTPGIPLRLRTVSAPGSGLPSAIQLDAAQRTAVVALVDDAMVIDRKQWGPYLRQIWEQARQPGSPHLLLPVALSESSFKLDPRMSAQMVRLSNRPQRQHADTLVRRLAHGLCRMLLSAPSNGNQLPVKVFLSHAKRDGERLVKRFRRYFQEQTQLTDFFDAHAILEGDDWIQTLDESAAACGALLAVHTDTYASREWCRREVLVAKDHAVPVLVVHAVQKEEKRSFPYLGNVPTYRWPTRGKTRFETVEELLLLEILRCTYFHHRLSDLANLYEGAPPSHPMPYAPELVTALNLRARQAADPSTVFVYPEPPLGTAELQRLHQLDPSLRFTTPTLLPLFCEAPS